MLGGTTEARELAHELDARPGIRVTSSLAGRVRRPVLPDGTVRVGGFGGVEGMAAWLAEHTVDAVIDATHPFAAAISGNAARAAAQVHVPLLVLRRPGWVADGRDRWLGVDSLAAAARVVPGLGDRPFLTTGRQGLGAFASLDAQEFLIRTVDPPTVPLPPRHVLILDRGPYSLDGELTLLRRHAIDVLVTKDSGGDATAAKLEAARRHGLPVVMVRRPPVPAGVQVVETVQCAVQWLEAVASR